MKYISVTEFAKEKALSASTKPSAGKGIWTSVINFLKQMDKALEGHSSGPGGY